MSSGRGRLKLISHRSVPQNFVNKLIGIAYQLTYITDQKVAHKSMFSLVAVCMTCIGLVGRCKNGKRMHVVDSDSNVMQYSRFWSWAYVTNKVLTPLCLSRFHGMSTQKKFEIERMITYSTAADKSNQVKTMELQLMAFLFSHIWGDEFSYKNLMRCMCACVYIDGLWCISHHIMHDQVCL